MLRSIFGKNLKLLRKERKLTQEAAAELCDMSSKYWGRLEREEQAATLDMIEQISKGLNVPAELLLATRTQWKDSFPSEDKGSQSVSDETGG